MAVKFSVRLPVGASSPGFTFFDDDGDQFGDRFTSGIDELVANTGFYWVKAEPPDDWPGGCVICDDGDGNYAPPVEISAEDLAASLATIIESSGESAAATITAAIESGGDSLSEELTDIVSGMSSSGGGVLNARIAVSSIAPNEYLEVIQGEGKIVTFIVEADGRFDNASANEIMLKLQDPSGNTIVKTDDEITRVTEELDVQVFRATLDGEETALLEDGLLKIEIVFDAQKARLTHALKVLEQIPIEES